MEKKIINTYLLFFLMWSLSAFPALTEEKKVETKRSGYWTYYCKNFEEQRQCEIARRINIDEQDETFLIIYKITKDIKGKKKENLNVFTPPASRIIKNKRLKISFDEKTKFTRSFVECNDDSCLAIFKGSRMLQYSMKKFNNMKITFYVSGDDESISLTLPNDGFLEAYENINQRLKSY